MALFLSILNIYEGPKKSKLAPALLCLDNDFFSISSSRLKPIPSLFKITLPLIIKFNSDSKRESAIFAGFIDMLFKPL